ncbi:MAG: cupin domain-containing protein [Bifidobacteriaceae bacterium]|jgi:glucose-6-phosphate isomerase|nr:cupin domain-containing protein [Bifidobacteriaceae bacterium]
MTAVAQPTSVVIHPSGLMEGRNGEYNKYLGDLAGVYQDATAYEAELAAKGADTLVYRVEENRVGSGEGALILGTSTVLPGKIGREYALTRGHIHAKASRAEIYYCIAGHGVMLLETIDGQSQAWEMTPGTAVHVPGHWIHRSVNVGPEPLCTVFIYDEDAGQDYGIIGRAGGMAQLIVDDGAGGWQAEPNPNHRGYQAR